MEDNSNKLYSKWLDNDLPPDKKKEFETSSDGKILKKIVEEVDTWKVEPLQHNYADLKNKLDSQKKTQIIPLYRRLAIAASLFIIMSLGFAVYKINFESTEYATNDGITKNINLPDGSTIVLFPNSSIKYKNYNWEKDRTINLQGNAYFVVSKKGKFEVQFDNGNVSVLGTQFLIENKGKSSTVRCYEGRVACTLNNTSFELTQGEGMSTKASKFEFDSHVSNSGDEYINFKESRLREVLTSLALTYDLEFEYNDVDLNKLYTGRFPKSDKIKALEQVLIPLGYSFVINENRISIK